MVSLDGAAVGRVKSQSGMDFRWARISKISCTESFVAQRFHGIEPRSFVRGPDAEEEADRDRDDDSDDGGP